MVMNSHISAELDLLALFDLSNSNTGIKVHSHDASVAAIAAAQRLFDKKMISQADGGYLTPMGREAAENLQRAVNLLSPG